MVWQPAASHVLEVLCPGSFFKFLETSLSLLPLRPTIFEQGDIWHVIFWQPGRSLQLCVRNGPVEQAGQLLIEALVQRARLSTHLASIACLNDLCSTGELRGKYFKADNRSRRLAQVLQALDGKISGLTNREIAISLFGEQRVRGSWSDPGQSLRDQVRRAIARGRHLMNGGYRDLLK